MSTQHATFGWETLKQRDEGGTALTSRYDLAGEQFKLRVKIRTNGETIGLRFLIVKNREDSWTVIAVPPQGGVLAHATRPVQQAAWTAVQKDLKTLGIEGVDTPYAE